MGTCTELVEKGDKQGLLERLEEEERDLNSRDEQGRTLLDLATILGREEIVHLLVEKGADVNLANPSGSHHMAYVIHIQQNQQGGSLPYIIDTTTSAGQGID